MPIKKNRSVLITGVSGFLAQHLVEGLTARGGCELFGISDIQAAPQIRSRLTDFQILDIRETSQLSSYLSQVQPSLVYHLAAVTNVGFSWENPQLTYEVNLCGSANLIEAMARSGHKSTVVLMSSAELYDHHTGPMSESTPIRCRSPYALSKWAMENLVELYARHSQLSFLLLRSFNFTGPGQSPSFVASDFARQIALIERGESKPEIEVGNLSAERDFSDVRDIARYLVALGLDSRGVSRDTINLCSGRSITIQQILDHYLSLCSREIAVKIDTKRFRPIDKPILLGDPSRLNGVYGLTPAFTLEMTLRDTLDHWRDWVKL